MKKLLYSLLSAFLCCAMSSAQEVWEPMADSAAIVTSGKARFTVLTPQLIRIQYSGTSKFEDRATFAVVNRKLPVPRFSQREEDGMLIIETDSLTLTYRVGSSITKAVNSRNLRITFNLNGKNKLWYPGKDDALNLLGTNRTLDGAIGDTHRSMLENGILSRDGWALLDESFTTLREDSSQSFAFDTPVDGIPWAAKPVDPNAIDWYFFGYGHNYKQALQDYVRIAGRQPIPPYYMFGYWYSKYQAYNTSEFQQLVRDMENKKVPHDVIMFDMDWHKSGWTGWTWNTKLISNPTQLINWMHLHNMKVSLNLHPADGVGNHEEYFSEVRNDMGLPSSTTNVPWRLEDSTFYRAMFKNIIRKRENQGVDFWWIDWQQKKTTVTMPGLGNTFWCNHVFFNDMQLNRPDRRPVILHRWGGNGSHRYPIGFSGDTFATYGTMRYEAYFTATAANICMGYWSHDGGGYLQPAEAPTDEELVLRWHQYCIFTPIFRTHGSSQSSSERRIWKFKNFDLQNQAMQLRYQLVPYIYTAARQAYDTGVSICRPLYYEWPEENKAYSVQDQYLFGNDMLIAPVFSESSFEGNTAQRTTWLPKGQWFDMCRGRLIEGDKEITDYYALNEIPYFIRQGGIIPCNPNLTHLKSRPDTLCLWVIPGQNGKGEFYEDEGDTQGYTKGEYALTTFSQTRQGNQIQLTIHPRQGTFNGIPATRAWKIEFMAQEFPQQVCVDGEPVEGWNYDEVSRILTLRLDKRDCAQPTNITLQVEGTSIEQNTQQPLPSMAYNPSAETLTIQAATAAQNVVLSITDLSGRQVLRLTAKNQAKSTFSLSSLPRGSYICRANADGKVVTRKILKF